MQNTSVSPSTFQTWNKALGVIKEKREIFVRIGILTIFLPYLLAVCLLAGMSNITAHLIQNMKHDSYLSIVDPLFPFLIIYIFIGFLLISSICTGFISLVKVAASSFREEQIDLLPTIKLSLKQTFPHGLVIFMFCSLLSLEQIFLGPFRIFTFFGLMATVILVTDQKNCLNSIRQAIFFKYSSPIHGGGFAAAFVLIGLSALVFAWEKIMEFIYMIIIQGDEFMNVDRFMWSNPLPGFPFSPMFFLAQLSYAACGAILLVVIASFLVSLFYSVRSHINHMI